MKAAFLFQAQKRILGDAELAKDFKGKRGPDFLAPVHRDGYSASVWMIPAFMTAGLSCFEKAQFARGVLKVTRCSARHE